MLLAQYENAKTRSEMQYVPEQRVLSSPSQVHQVALAKRNGTETGTDMAQDTERESQEQRLDCM
jgi:hypothetical protein